MKISEKRRSALYSAIFEPIMLVRIKGEKGVVDWDRELFDLNRQIWREVQKVLGLEYADLIARKPLK